MKAPVIAIALSALTLSPAFAADATEDPCAAKAQALEAQIAEARAHANRHRVAGLERALEAVQQNCTPESVRQELEKDVTEAREKVAEREAELREARAEGRDADKIARREAKLAEAREKLRLAEEALAQ